ncbi:MAG: hypothetical protein ACNA8J_10290 [Gammaproteobacteria bacterium]
MTSQMTRSWKYFTALVALSLAAGAAAAERHELAHGALRVQIETSNERHLAQFGPRFDRTAIVSSITLDGEEFLGTWGLCDEFGLYGRGVLGYEVATEGELFVKIGVGALVRNTAAPYHFAHPYPLHTSFPVVVEASETQLTVRQDSAPKLPHRYSYRKTYTIETGDRLTIHYELHNSGDVEWSFEHYNHHWFRLQDKQVGPAYRLTTGFLLPAPDAETKLLVEPTSLEMATHLDPGGAAYYASNLTDVPAADNRFELSVGGATTLQYQGSFEPTRFALYASEDGFCPEVFKRAVLAPGETATWSASYRFILNRD